MNSKNDRLRDLLKRNWVVNLDKGHKSALKHKIEELSNSGEHDDLLEYGGGDWSTRKERIEAMQPARTDFRPVWVAVAILIAVAILLLPRYSNPSDYQPHTDFLSASSYNIIILQGGAKKEPSKGVGEKQSQNDNYQFEDRFVYISGDLTWESTKVLPYNKIRKIFMETGWNQDTSEPIRILKASVPVGYELKYREGENLYYSPPELD
jgi:hypothetical protein